MSHHRRLVATQKIFGGGFCLEIWAAILSYLKLKHVLLYKHVFEKYVKNEI
jgi:hypothetical protein